MQISKSYYCTPTCASWGHNSDDSSRCDNTIIDSQQTAATAVCLACVRTPVTELLCFLRCVLLVVQNNDLQATNENSHSSQNIRYTFSLGISAVMVQSLILVP
jgi:hypothetical protein